MFRRATLTTALTTLFLLLAIPAYACGFLVAENGAIRLVRTATLAAYVDGVEHYVTSFEYQGGGEFGSIIPLPGVPTVVERGGSWTLQRLQREVDPPREFEGAALATAGSADEAVVLQEVQVDALDITILSGGGAEVLEWANRNGFDLVGDDTLELLEFYANRSPIFMAAKFDASRAQTTGQQVGDGTPIHLAIPTPNPWVPLRILGYAKDPSEVVDADVFLLTPQEPEILRAGDGILIERSEPASQFLLDDLRSDENSAWVPERAWFTYVRIEEESGELTYDLAIDVNGEQPSKVAAGLVSPARPDPLSDREPLIDFEPARSERSRTVGWLALVALLAMGLVLGASAWMQRSSNRVRAELTGQIATLNRTRQRPSGEDSTRTSATPVGSGSRTDT